MKDFKDIYKEPIFYYIALPIVIGIWPLLLWLVYLPGLDQQWEEKKSQYLEAQNIMEEILLLDGDERLAFDAEERSSEQFDYANAVSQVARSIGIPSQRYRFSTSMPIVSAGQRSQSADVNLEDISVGELAEFIATIQLRWANLQCTQIRLRTQGDDPDNWRADVQFQYFF